MNERGLNELFADTLRDVYYAEQEVLKTLPKMAEMAEATELKEAFGRHTSETEEQLRRLEQIFTMLDEEAKGKKCLAIDGIIKEGEKVSSEYEGTAAVDAALISSAQAVEHYEITRYGTLRKWAEELGLDEAAKLLDETLQQESQTDEMLSQLAEAGVNRRAGAGS